MAPVPTEGIFQKSRNVSVFGNKNLCGGVAELKAETMLRNKSKRAFFNEKENRHWRWGSCYFVYSFSNGYHLSLLVQETKQHETKGKQQHTSYG